MKNIICILFFLIAFQTVSAQTKKPVAKGFVTITTGQKMPFINLRFQDDMVVFMNTATNSEYTYFLKTVKVIQDADKNIVYEQPKPVAVPVVENDKQVAIQQSDKAVLAAGAVKPSELIFKNCNRAILDGKKLNADQTRTVLKVNPEVLKDYDTGRRLNTIGNIALGAGLGMILGQGLINLNKADDDDVDYNDINNSSDGVSPVMIAGIVVAVASIPLKIVGHAKVKESISDYNNRVGITQQQTTYEVFAVAKGNGLALVLKW